MISAQAADPPPIRTDQTEKVAVRLVQIDAVVDESKLAGRTLTAADIDVMIGSKAIEGFTLDRLCGEPEPETEPPGGSVPPASTASAVVKPQRPTIVFFFDQPHLTLAGREQAFGMAKEIVDRVIVDGARGSIVSSASRLETFVPATEDRARLIAGLTAMRNDPRALDTYAMTEQSRVEEIFGLPCGTVRFMRTRVYAREEQTQARLARERLAIALDSLADAPPPKALVYFGDTLRQQAGLHFYQLSESCPAGDLNDIHPLDSESLVPAAASDIDAIIAAAISRGVHLFTVAAQGLTAPTGVASRSPVAAEMEMRRTAQAENTLVGLAQETGGEAFLRADGRRIADRLAARVSCPYIISFPPGDLPRDRPLPLTVVSRLPGVSIHVQGRIVIPSESALLAARLRAAFSNPSGQDDGSLHVGLIPRDMDGKAWRVSVQVRLDADAPHKTGVELGASVIQRGRVVQEFSRSIATSGRARPLVVEQSATLEPGPVRLVAVAHDPESGDIQSSDDETEWPSLDKGDAAIAPIAVLQARAAAVARDGAVDVRNALVVDEVELLDPGQGTALRSVVCRGMKMKGTLIVERSLSGVPDAGFTPMTLEADGPPCLQTTDAIKPGAVTEPFADYRIVVRTEREIIADQRKELRFRARAAE